LREVDGAFGCHDAFGDGFAFRQDVGELATAADLNT
jgi:hypothetical protein